MTDPRTRVRVDLGKTYHLVLTKMSSGLTHGVRRDFKVVAKQLSLWNRERHDNTVVIEMHAVEIAYLFYSALFF